MLIKHGPIDQQGRRRAVKDTETGLYGVMTWDGEITISPKFSHITFLHIGRRQFNGGFSKRKRASPLLFGFFNSNFQNFAIYRTDGICLVPANKVMVGMRVAHDFGTALFNSPIATTSHPDLSFLVLNSNAQETVDLNALTGYIKKDEKGRQWDAECGESKCSCYNDLLVTGCCGAFND